MNWKGLIFSWYEFCVNERMFDILEFKLRMFIVFFKELKVDDLWLLLDLNNIVWL